MTSINELVVEIAKIKNAANSIEVKGVQNMQYVMNICERCDHIIDNLQAITEQIQNESNSDKEGDVDAGQRDTDVS